MVRWFPIVASLLLATATAVAVAARERSPAELEARALERMGRQAYESAADLLLAALEADPGRASAHYNLACCHSRLGRTDAAATALEAAWRNGFHDLDLARTDPDLAALRSSDVGRRLLGRLADEHAVMLRRGGEPIQLEARVLAGVRVVAPAVVEEGRRYPLVVLLHGFGGTAEGFAGLFEAAGLSPAYVVCAPFAPYPMPGGSTPGGSWFPPMAWYRPEAAATSGERLPEALEARELAVTRELVLRVVDEVVSRYPADPERVVVAGHSQGGVLAYELALDHPDRVWGTVAIGARLLRRSQSPQRLAAASGRRFLLVHSPEDASIPIDAARTARRMLKDAGAEVRLVEYAGGHGITVEVMRAVERWIDRELEAAATRVDGAGE